MLKIYSVKKGEELGEDILCLGLDKEDGSVGGGGRIAYIVIGIILILAGIALVWGQFAYLDTWCGGWKILIIIGAVLPIAGICLIIYGFIPNKYLRKWDKKEKDWKKFTNLTKCPNCGELTRFINEKAMWWCDRCSIYLDVPERLTSCPDCRGSLTCKERYKWYCPQCRSKKDPSENIHSIEMEGVL